MIRSMTLNDISQIQSLDAAIWKTDTKRRTEGIEVYMKKSKYASLVYELDNKIVGFIFNHIWGNFGWFGFFGVDPNYQNQNIGKELINATIKLMKNDYKIDNIGLATMPYSQYNLGLYTKMGFKPSNLSMNMRVDIDSYNKNKPISEDYAVNFIDIEDSKSYTEVVQNIISLSNEISPGLDLSSQLLLIKEGGFGKVLTIKKNTKFVGFALCHTKHIREISTDCIEVRTLTLSNSCNHKEAISTLLSSLCKYGKKINYKSLSLDCNLENYEVYEYLLKDCGFKINSSLISLIMGDDEYLKKQNGIVLCRWAG